MCGLIPTVFPTIGDTMKIALTIVVALLVLTVLGTIFLIYYSSDSGYMIVTRHTPKGDVSTTYSGYVGYDISWKYKVLSLDYGKYTYYYEIDNCDVRVYK